MVNPAYYLSVDPRGFNMERFINTFRSQFDPSLETRSPHFDLKGEQYPATLDDIQDWGRAERRCLCGPRRVLWEQICDYIELQIGSMDFSSCRRVLGYTGEGGGRGGQIRPNIPKLPQSCLLRHQAQT